MNAFLLRVARVSPLRGGACGRPLTLCRARSTTAAAPALRIIWGSQTGTAQMFADQLQQEAAAAGASVSVHDALDFAAGIPPDAQTVNVLLLACYGVGEPTDNAKPLVKWIMDDTNCLPSAAKDVKYTIFGLGSSATHADRYNVVGRQVDARLQSLGAHCVFPRGEGDDGGIIEADFDEWSQEFLAWWSSQKPQGSTAAKQAAKAVETPAPTKSSVVEGDTATVLSNINLCPQSSRETWEIKLRGVSGQYTTGDHVAIIPRNDKSVLSRAAPALAQCGAIDASLAGKLESQETVTSPCDIAVRERIASAMDLVGPPSPAVVRALAERATATNEAAQLTAWSSREGYIDNVRNERLDVLDLLKRHPSVRISLDELQARLGSIRPRYYSIASSSVVDPDDITLLYRVVEHKAAGTETRRGLCTSYLAHISETDTIAASLRPSTFRLPADNRPLLMIAGGTGIAPFHAFVQERDATRATSDALLIYGYRDPSEYVYGEFLEQATSPLTIHKAEGEPIDAAMDGHADTIRRMLAEGGNVYMCGGAAGFGSAVWSSLSRILAKESGGSEDKGRQAAKHLLQVGRLHEDLAD